MMIIRKNSDGFYWDNSGQLIEMLELEATAGCNYHVYMAFIAHDRSKRSKSVYLGRVGV